MNRDKLHRMTKIAKILNQRLEDTGYETLNLTTFAEEIQKKPYFGFYCKPVGDLAKTKSPNGVLIFYMEPQPDKSSIGTGSITSMATVIDEHSKKNQDPSTLLLILEGNLSHKAKIDLANVVSGKNARLVQFQAEEMMFNPTKHKLVSKHVVLHKEEESKWLEETGLLKSQLPHIGRDNIQIRWHDGDLGDVVRIVGRPSPTVGQTVSHYLVCHVEPK